MELELFRRSTAGPARRGARRGPAGVRHRRAPRLLHAGGAARPARASSPPRCARASTPTPTASTPGSRASPPTRRCARASSRCSASRPRRGPRSTPPRSASSSRAPSRPTTATSSRTGARCARSAPSASRGCCRCARRARRSPCPPPRGASRRQPGRSRSDEKRGYKASQQVPQGPQAAEGDGAGRARRRPAARARRLVPLRDPRRRQHGVAVLRAAARLLDPRAVRRVRGPRARPRRARRHRPGHPGRSPPATTAASRGASRAASTTTTTSTSSGSQGKERYRFKGKTRKMSCRNETFKVSGAKAVKRRFCRTVHGPVQQTQGERAYARRYAIWGRELQHARRPRRAQRRGSVAAGRQRRGEADLEREPAGRRRRRPHRLVASRPAAAAPEALGRAAAAPRHGRGGVARAAAGQAARRR